MGKPKTIDAFFKKKNVDSGSKMSSSSCNPQLLIPEQEQRPSKIPRIESQEVDIATIERDPRKRIQICEHPVNQQDETRRAYLKAGPYQYIPAAGTEYPFTEFGKNRRRFSSSWYKQFPWLEYSPITDAAYCLYCFLINQNPTGHFGSTAFTIEGF